MTYNLFLDSNLAKLQGSNANQASHDLTIHFTHRLGWTIKKIESDVEQTDHHYGNNKLNWRKKSEAWQTLTFPDGMYGNTNICGPE